MKPIVYLSPTLPELGVVRERHYIFSSNQNKWVEEKPLPPTDSLINQEKRRS